MTLTWVGGVGEGALCSNIEQERVYENHIPWFEGQEILCHKFHYNNIRLKGFKGQLSIRDIRYWTQQSCQKDSYYINTKAFQSLSFPYTIPMKCFFFYHCTLPKLLALLNSHRKKLCLFTISLLWIRLYDYVHDKRCCNNLAQDSLSREYWTV